MLFILMGLIVINYFTIILFFERVSIKRKTNVSDESHVPSVKRTFLVTAIISAGQNSERRKVIRSTWGKLANDSLDAKYFFVIADREIKYDENELRNEMREQDDILLLRNVSDSFDSLTTKVLKAFVHVHEQWDFRFLLKCDDDSYVRVDNIVSELKRRFLHVDNLYWGYFDGSQPIQHSGLYKETKYFLCDLYLPYALGGGYLLSQSLVQFIAENERRLV